MRYLILFAMLSLSSCATADTVPVDRELVQEQIDLLNSWIKDQTAQMNTSPATLQGEIDSEKAKIAQWQQHLPK